MSLPGHLFCRAHSLKNVNMKWYFYTLACYILYYVVEPDQNNNDVKKLSYKETTTLDFSNN